MRVKCLCCKSKSYIRSYKTTSHFESELSCICQKSGCFHVFTSTLSYKHAIHQPKLLRSKNDGIIFRNRRIICHYCGSETRIKSRRTQSDAVSDIYCACQCGHVFVATLAFKVTLQPPRSETLSLLKQLVQSMSADQQLQLFEQLKQP